MVKPNLTRSADLHLRIGAFGSLFTILVVSFQPLPAFVLALAAVGILAKL